MTKKTRSGTGALSGSWPWIAAVTALIVLYFSDVLFRGAAFVIRDHIMMYLPREASYIAAVKEGVLPHWDPLFMGGQPFAANPGRQLFYPPHLLVLIGDLATGYGIYLVFHLVVAATGMFALLRLVGARRTTATLGAVALALSGPMLTLMHLLPMLFTVSWMPWIARFTEAFLRTRRPREFLGAAVTLCLLALGGDPVQALLAGLLMVGWSLARQDWTDRREAISCGGKDLVRVLAIGFTALALSSVQLILSLDFARDTVRSERMSFEMVSHWSFPPQRVVEFLFPSVFDHIQGVSLYPSTGGEGLLFSVHLGLVMSILALAGLVRRAKGWAWMLATILLSGIAAIGSHAPLLRIAWDAGLISSIRYPEKLIVPTLVLLVFWSALTFDRMRDGDMKLSNVVLGVGVALTLVAGLLVLSKGGAIEPATMRSNQLYWGRMFLVGAVSTVLLFASARSKKETTTFALLAFVAFFDLGLLARHWTPTAKKGFLDAPTATATLDEDKSSYRIFNDAALQFLDYRTVESQRWFALVNLVLHRNGMFPLSNGIWGYSSILEWDTEHTALMPYVQFQRAMYEVRRSGQQDWLRIFASMANARFTTEFRPIESVQLEPDTDALSIRPIEFVRLDDAPRYYFATSLRRAESPEEFVADLKGGRWSRGATWVDIEPFDPGRGEVLDVDQSRHRIELHVRAEGRSYLNIAITPHRYWSATIDGERSTLHVTNVGFHGREVPEGEHKIELLYHNPVVKPALAVSVTVLSLLVIGTIVLERRRTFVPDEPESDETE